MKKKLLSFFVFSFLFIAKLFAQPTLTNANSSFIPFDSYITQPVYSAGVPSQDSGKNKTWTYSNLVDSGRADAFQAVAASSTPYASSFAGSNIALKTSGDSVYIYFTSSDTALLQNGVATYDGTTLRSDPPRAYLHYPFTYGDKIIRPVSQELPEFNTTLKGLDTIKGDGYGTLVVKGITYQNVLRLRYAETLTATYSILFSSITVNTYTVNYAYFRPGTHAPLFTDALSTTITTTSILGLPPTKDTSVTRDISYLREFVLPVTYQSFTASLQNKDVSIQWKTTQEINTDHYTIQRSLTGRDFQDVSSVKASGSTQGSVYSYIDKSFAAGNMPATVYYRIQGTDKDGRQTLSSIAFVHGGHAVVISVYPNPANDVIRISGSDAQVADVIAVYDAKGSLIRQWRNYSVSQPINIASLTKGTYLVKVTINGKTATTTVIKQ